MTQAQCDQLVNSYALPWWSSTHAPAKGGMLSAATLDKCLEHHQQQLSIDMQGQSTVQSPVLSPSNIIPSQTNTNSCPSSCLPHSGYQSLTNEFLGQLQATQSYTLAMVTSSSTQIDLSNWHISSFLALHKQVLLKEMQSEPLDLEGHGKGSKTTKLSWAVSEQAKATLETMNPGLHKWAWGETLSCNEVLEMKNVNKKHVYSGYYTTLWPGNFTGDNSQTDTAPTGT